MRHQHRVRRGIGRREVPRVRFGRQDLRVDPLRAEARLPQRVLLEASSFGWRKLMRAGLLVLLAASPAAAQPANELAVGGGYHAAFDLGDIIQMPAAPSVDVRLVRWTSESWGIAGRAMAGLGSGHPHETRIVERRYPMYFQVLLRYRTQEPGGGSMHVGFGGGIMAYSQTFDLGHGDGRTREEFKYFVHLLAVEALRSIPLGDRLSMKVGATLVLPFHVQPVVLLAWKL